MPYGNIDLDCDIFLCMHNENGIECSCNCHIDSLNPNKADCSHFHFVPGCFDVTVKKVGIAEMLELIKEQEIPFVSLDEESPKFQTVVASSGEYCLVQGSDEDIKQFRFWKSTDGGFGYTHKNQLELFQENSL
jgi:hypothetical protein